MLIIEIILAIVALGFAEAFVKPLAISAFNAVVMPKLGTVFSKHINPHMGEWLGNQTGESLADAIVAVIGSKDLPIAGRDELRSLIVKTIDSAPAPKKLTGKQMAETFKNVIAEENPTYAQLPEFAQNALAKGVRRMYDPAINADKNLAVDVAATEVKP